MGADHARTRELEQEKYERIWMRGYILVGLSVGRAKSSMRKEALPLCEISRDQVRLGEMDEEA